MHIFVKVTHKRVDLPTPVDVRCTYPCVPVSGVMHRMRVDITIVMRVEEHETFIAENLQTNSK